MEIWFKILSDNLILEKLVQVVYVGSVVVVKHVTQFAQFVQLFHFFFFFGGGGL